MPKPTLPDSVELRQKRGELQETRKLVKTIFDEAETTDENGGVVYDLSKVKCLGKDYEGKSGDITKKLRDLDEEMNTKYDEISELEDAYRAKNTLDQLGEKRGVIQHGGNGAGVDVDNPGAGVRKTLGQKFVENDLYLKKWSKGEKGGVMKIDDFGIKTLMTTTAGWAPESVRSGLLVEDAQRPIQVMDILPMGTINQASEVYMEETTFTNNAAEVSEGNAYGEAALALTEQTNAVRKVGVLLPITDEQLEDVSQAESYVNNRLRFMLAQRIDGQVLVGNGTAPNLRGINNVVGIQTQAKGTDPVPDAIYKGLTLVRTTGWAMPNYCVLHPNDWQGIRLLRTSDGVYIWGSPAEAGPDRIWGIPVVQSTMQTEGTGLVGDFANFCALSERRGVELKITDSDQDDFTKGKQKVRADTRLVFTVYRPAAFAQITGI